MGNKTITPEVRLTDNQIEIIVLLFDKNCMIMNDGWVTGGHGFKCNKNSVNGLEKKGFIQNGRLTELAENFMLSL